MKTKILKEKVNAGGGVRLSGGSMPYRGFLFLFSSASTGGEIVAEGPPPGAADVEV